MHAKNREFIQRDLENLDLSLEDIQLRNGVTHAQVRNAAFDSNVNMRARNDIRTKMNRQEALRQQILELEAEIESIKPHLHDYRYKRF